MTTKYAFDEEAAMKLDAAYAVIIGLVSIVQDDPIKLQSAKKIALASLGSTHSEYIKTVQGKVSAILSFNPSK
jgi:hypothetical protein